MAATKGYTGWALDPEQRKIFLTLFPPSYERVIAHHCTAEFGVTSDHPLPTADHGEVVGVADDGGSTWHITWSLAPGRKPVESNQVIRTMGWEPTKPITIKLRPQFFPMGS